MSRHRLLTLSVLIFISVTGLGRLSRGADPKSNKEEVVQGIMFDGNKNSITVRTDGEEKADKYVIDESDKKAVAGLKGVFGVNRVRLKYTTDGDTRHLVAIERVAVRASGVVIGEVIEAHGWWVEVKPKDGFPDGYAAHFPTDRAKAVMEKLKTLQKGDVVAIKFTSDGERHRIEAIEKKGE